MSRCNVIVVGASAGGVETLTRLVAQLPANLGAAVAVVLHTPEDAPSVLPAILSRRGPLRAEHARDDEPLLHGRIYVAPPGRHLLVKRRTVRAVIGPHENGHRPAVDPMFRTAARAHGRRVIGVVLSGSLDDGTAGLSAIKAAGGAALVQEPSDALFDGMPVSAIANVDVDFVGNVDALAAELARRTRELCADRMEEIMVDQPGEELDAVEMDRGAPDPDRWPASPSAFTCPECHGSLFELRDGVLVRYRCRTGHAFSPEALLAEQSQSVEAALWTALRALEENAALLRRLHEKALGRSQSRSAERYLAQAQHVEASARVIREALLREGASAA